MSSLTVNEPCLFRAADDTREVARFRTRVQGTFENRVRFGTWETADARYLAADGVQERPEDGAARAGDCRRRYCRVVLLGAPFLDRAERSDGNYTGGHC